MSQRGFRPNEKITRKTLNRALSAPADVNLSGPRVNKGRGQTVITDEEEIFLRVTGAATSPLRYAWQEVYHDKASGGWKNTNRSGSTDSDPLFEINNAAVGSGATVYTARRSRASGAWTFTRGSGGGAVDITSGETAILILGTYGEYKDCPGVPPKPPTLKTACGEDTGVLCVPAYAYAVYVRCGYIWLKIGDTRDFGVWANGLNGGTLSAMRRLYVPRWGGDVDPATGLPDPDAECMGLAVLEYCSQGSIDCTCPTCLSSPPPGSCLWVRFRTMPRPVALPANPTGCVDLRVYMDEHDLWDKEITIPITVLGCTAGGSDDLFDFEWQFLPLPDLECDWGPNVFNPCDPCRHWGRLSASIGVSQGGSTANCGGSGQWSGEWLAKEVCDLLCDCGNGPLKPAVTKICNNCGTAPDQWHVIVEGSVELICCPGDTIMGGTPGSLPEDFISGGTPGSLPTDFIDGNF